MIDLSSVIASLSLMFQANDLLIIDALPTIETAMLKLIEMKSIPGDNISSIVHGFEYDGVLLTGPVEPELQQLHIRIIDSAINQIDARFKVLQQSPITDFAVLDYRQWPHETSELAVYGKEHIENLVKHFAPVLTEEEVEGVVKEFTSSRFMWRS